MEDGKVYFVKAQEKNFMTAMSNDRLNELSGIQNIKLTIYSVTISHYRVLLIANRFIRTTPCPAQSSPGLNVAVFIASVYRHCTRQRSLNRTVTQGTGIFIMGFEAARLLSYRLRFCSPQVFRDWHRMRCQLAPT